MIGTLLNERYKVTSELGEGGMATVYGAIDQTLQREVAIKILHPHLAKDFELNQRFHQEASIAAKLEHPNILKIYDFGKHTDGRSFMVAEIIRGQDWHNMQVERLRKEGTAFDPLFCAMVCEEVLKGLQEAHAQRYVHRDVKPDNVMITDDGQVKITDFGIAKNVGTSITVIGHFLGSPSYASPEQVQGKPVDFRSDLYSVGIILYEALTNRLPFNGQSAPEVMMKICQGNHVPLRQARRDAPAELDAIVTRALKLDRDERYRKTSAMLQDFRDFLAGRGIDNSRAGLEEYFKDPKGFLARHPEPQVEKAKVHPPRRAPSPAGGGLGGVSAPKPAAAQRAIPVAAARPGAMASLPGSQSDEPRRVPQGMGGMGGMEATGNAERRHGQTQTHGRPFAHTRRETHSAPNQNYNPRNTATIREHARRQVLSYPDRGTPQGQGSSFPSGLLIFLIPAIAFAGVVYLVSGGKPRIVERIQAGRATERPGNTLPSRAPLPSATLRPDINARPLDSDSPADGPASNGGSNTAAGKDANETPPSPPSAGGAAGGADTPRKRPPPPQPREPLPAVRTPNRPTRPSDVPGPEGGKAVASIGNNAVPTPVPPSRVFQPRPEPTRLSLLTIPGAVPVYVNGRLAGHSGRDGEARVFEVRPGRVTVRIPAQMVAGTRYDKYERTLFLENGKPLNLGVIRLTPIRTLTINIVGQGVIVRVNENPYAMSGKPLVLQLPEGRVVVDARAANGRSLRRALDLRGDNFTLNTSLE